MRNLEALKLMCLVSPIDDAKSEEVGKKNLLNYLELYRTMHGRKIHCIVKHKLD